MQTLVYENYNKFISATDTIKKVCLALHNLHHIHDIQCKVNDNRNRNFVNNYADKSRYISYL